MTRHQSPSKDNDPENNHRKVQVVVISSEEKGQLLLLQTNLRRGQFWQNVTGSVEKGETFLEGARRELQEETGIALGPQDGPSLIELPKTYFFHDRWGKDVEEKCFLCLLARTPPHIILDSSEHSAFKWVDLSTVGPAHYQYPSNYEAFCLALQYVRHGT